MTDGEEAAEQRRRGRLSAQSWEHSTRGTGLNCSRGRGKASGAEALSRGAGR